MCNNRNLQICNKELWIEILVSGRAVGATTALASAECVAQVSFIRQPADALDISLVFPGLDTAPAPSALLAPRRRALEVVAEELCAVDQLSASAACVSGSSKARLCKDWVFFEAEGPSLRVVGARMRTGRTHTSSRLLSRSTYFISCLCVGLSMPRRC